jgi:hypothetical protein
MTLQPPEPPRPFVGTGAQDFLADIRIRYPVRGVTVFVLRRPRAQMRFGAKIIEKPKLHRL